MVDYRYPGLPLEQQRIEIVRTTYTAKGYIAAKRIGLRLGFDVLTLETHLSLWQRKHRPGRPRTNTCKSVGRPNMNVKYRTWRKDVLTRDGHVCQECGTPSDLHAHHIKDWDGHPELRYVVSNGLTLCRKHHKQWHAREELR